MEAHAYGARTSCCRRIHMIGGTPDLAVAPVTVTTAAGRGKRLKLREVQRDGSGAYLGSAPAARRQSHSSTSTVTCLLWCRHAVASFLGLSSEA